jgi:periplasmic protein TonB
MPLNVRRFCYTALISASIVGFSQAQSVPTVPVAANPIAAGPTSGEVMRSRISKAKAFIAVRNYNAAIYELENIRRETADTAVHAVVNVLLMNSYLEQGDFKRAQEFLSEYHNLHKSSRPNSSAFYTAIAGQVVKVAKNRVERYRDLGLSVTDKTLPLEALTDLEKMRETLELVITHSREIGKTPAKSAEALVLLEEASTSRSILARDDYDARRWRDVVADTRDEVTNSRSVVTSAVADNTSGNTLNSGSLAAPKIDASAAPASQSDARPINSIREEPRVAATNQPISQSVADPARTEPPKVEAPRSQPEKIVVAAGAPEKTVGTAAGGPLQVGSLKDYATRQLTPSYPPIARTTRTTGVVRVDVLVDEKGDVANVTGATGPLMLQGAAKDAIRKWKFKPFTRDGQPVQANGFISFNFNL